MNTTSLRCAYSWSRSSSSRPGHKLHRACPKGFALGFCTHQRVLGGGNINSNGRRKCTTLLAAVAGLDLLLPENLGDNVQVVENTGGGIGLSAKRDIGAGEEILRVPEDHWITTRVVSSSEIGSLVAGLEPWLQLTLFLVHERGKVESGQGSGQEHYINSLPETLGSPAFWDAKELESIQGTQLWQSTQGYRYKDLQASLFVKKPGVFKSEIFTFEAFCWGVGSVRSRMHPPLEGDKGALVPMADLVAHSRKPNTVWELGGGNLLQKGTSLVVRATRDVSSSEALGMDYGAGNLDSKVALDYGVLDSNVLQGGYYLELQIPETDPDLDDKLDIVELGLGTSDGYSCNLICQEEPSEELLAFLRLLNCSGEDAFHLEAIFRNDAWDHMQLPVSEANEKMMCETMIGGCTEALQPYIAQSRSKPSVQGIGQKICGEEKAALEWTLMWFTKRKAEAASLEYYAERRLKSLNLLDDDGNTTFEDEFKGF